MTGRAMRRARSVLTLGATLLIAGLVVAPALAANPSTLTGEQLTGQPTITDPGATCTPTNAPPDGASHTFSYTATGVATGPYPGTFTESGTVTFSNTFPDQNGNPGGPISSWAVSFTIDSTAGQVVGDKRLSRTPGAFANCGDITRGGLTQFQRNASGTLNYGALIRIGARAYVDYGTSQDNVAYFQDPFFTFIQFSESFASALRQPIRIR
jgi:hypothetical protein